MLDQRDHAKARAGNLLGEEIAREQLRKLVAEADEAENRTCNRDRLEKAQIGEVEERTHEVGHRIRARWFVALAWALALLLGSAITGRLTAGIDAIEWLRPPPATHRVPLQKGDGMDDEPKREASAGEHLSSSLVQSRAELAILKRLEKDLGVELAKRRVPYHGSVMEVDGVAADDSLFVEAFARVTPMKSGQLKKVSADALKLIALQASYPDAKFVLAFVDEAVLRSIAGWQLAVLEQHGIECRVVEIPASLKQELLVAQADQKRGLATPGDD